jgi:hypothetical protein
VRPLSETLISILGSALQSGATHVDVDGSGVRLMRGKELLGVGAVEGEQLARLGDELCGLGAKREGTAKVNIMSPAGPLDLTVSLSASAITIVLRDEATEKAERAFSMVMARLVALGGEPSRETPATRSRRSGRGGSSGFRAGHVER